MRLSLGFALSCAASALAYQVLIPNAQQGWTNVGAQPLSWVMVATDPANFTAVLVNDDDSSASPLVLLALVEGDIGNTTVLPSDGWPAPGSAFRVNFVQNTTDFSTIFAQSDEFTITQGNTSSTTSGSGTSVTSPTSTAVVPPTVSAPASSASSSASGAVHPTSSSSGTLSTLNTHPNLAAVIGFFGLLSLIA